MMTSEDDKNKTAEPQHYRVIFQPAGRQGQIPAGTSLLDAARLLGVEIESICGGRQTCAKCQVRVEEGVPLRATALHPRPNTSQARGSARLLIAPTRDCCPAAA
jgi:ferredoxin